MKAKLFLLAMAVGLFAVGQTASPGDIVVTEIMIDPDGDERDQEWFEVYNTTNAAIDMNGWTIFDESSNGRAHVITAANPVLIPANGYAVFVGSADATLNGGMTAAANNIVYEYSYESPVGGPPDPNGTGTQWPTWNNESTYANGSTNDDGIRLEDQSGNVIDQILYGFGYAGLNAWPAMGAPSDTSYQLDANTLDAASNDDAVNWLESTATYGTEGMIGTPGTANFSAGGTPAIGPGDIVITEIMIDPDGSEGDNEYFEVYNTTANPIDMMNWVINDDSSSGRAHVITTSVVVAPNSYAVFAAVADPLNNQGITNVAYAYGFSSPIGGPVDMSGDQYPRFNNESSFDQDGETDGLSITSDTGVEIDEVVYDYGFGTAPIGWPTAGTSGGASWESNTFDAISNDLSSAWNRATATYGTNMQMGTPGVRNTLSIESATLGNVKLYPNPATNFMTISIENESWNSLNVYNAQGQQVLNIATYTERVDISSLKTGMYFVRVNADRGSDTLQLMIK